MLTARLFHLLTYSYFLKIVFRKITSRWKEEIFIKADMFGHYKFEVGEIPILALYALV